MKKKLTTLEKLEFIDKKCNETISISHYGKWQISSYGNNTFFDVDSDFYEKNDGHLTDESLEKLINKAYNIILENEK